MDNFMLEKIREELAIKIKEYIEIIVYEYKDYIPKDRLLFLKSIRDYKDIIRIEETGTISLFVRGNKIYFPLSIFKVIKMLKFIPGYGKDKEHMSCDKENLVINDNTFESYVKHIFISGATPLQYYNEILLHEVFHLCGVNGSYALNEGMTEYKTRKLALKYNLLTSGCGYPKEVKLILELEDVFGEDIINKLCFCSSPFEQFCLIRNNFGIEASKFYKELFYKSDSVFEGYITKKYSGVLGPLKKVKSYNKLNYSDCHELIKSYKEKSILKVMDDKEENNSQNNLKRSKDNFYHVAEIHEFRNQLDGYDKEHKGKKR